MGLVGPDGKPILVQGDGEVRCIFCVLAKTRASVDPEASGETAGELTGLFTGLQLMASVLCGSGLQPEQATRLLTVATSACAEHGDSLVLLQRAEDLWRPAVEQAVRNIQAAGTFVVGRSGGKVQGVGP